MSVLWWARTRVRRETHLDFGVFPWGQPIETFSATRTSEGTP